MATSRRPVAPVDSVAAVAVVVALAALGSLALLECEEWEPAAVRVGAALLRDGACDRCRTAATTAAARGRGNRRASSAS